MTLSPKGQGGCAGSSDLFDTGLQLAAERALREVGARPGLRAVVFTGLHGHFSAGGDVREMATLTGEAVAQYAARISRLTREVAALRLPVVAAVQGYALGGGCELALACDFRICTPSTRFGLPETPLGLIPGAGGTQRLPHLVGLSRAKDIVFSGRQVDAAEAARIGLADQVVPDADLPTAVMRWVARYTAHPAPAVAAAKQATIDAWAKLAQVPDRRKPGSTLDGPFITRLLGIEGKSWGPDLFATPETVAETGRAALAGARLNARDITAVVVVTCNPYQTLLDQDAFTLMRMLGIAEHVLPLQLGAGCAGLARAAALVAELATERALVRTLRPAGGAGREGSCRGPRGRY